MLLIYRLSTLNVFVERAGVDGGPLGLGVQRTADLTGFFGEVFVS